MALTTRWRLSAMLLVNAIIWPQAKGQAPAPPNPAHPTATGPYAVAEFTYKLPAITDMTVAKDREIELWSQIYWPESPQSERRPLILLLHGNHGTCGTGTNPRNDNSCQYTQTGTCPENYRVTPNHLGYQYLATRLASWGYAVIAINANRGITCGDPVVGDLGLNLMRGRLVLRHIQELANWDSNGGSLAHMGLDLTDRLDLSQVGLLGHSRGGEGMRAAYNLYSDPQSPWRQAIGTPVNFRGLFEIAPVDGQTAKVLDANGIHWAVLLPACDGDVTNLAGIGPYDRMLEHPSQATLESKSVFYVWGANHNFYNSEWQQSDAQGCFRHQPLFPQVGGSPQQRQTALASVMAFFLAHVGSQASPQMAQTLDPINKAAGTVTTITTVGRSRSESQNPADVNVVEDFKNVTGKAKDGGSLVNHNLTYSHVRPASHGNTRRAALISWQVASGDTFFQSNFANNGTGIDISNFQSFAFDAARTAKMARRSDTTDFHIVLVDQSGQVSNPVAISRYQVLQGPVGYLSAHTIMESILIPLKDFQSVDFTQIAAVRFVFDLSQSGELYISQIRFNRRHFALPVSRPSIQRLPPSLPQEQMAEVPQLKLGRAVLTDIDWLEADNCQAKLFFARGFPAQASLPSLVWPRGRSYLFRRDPLGDNRFVSFIIPCTEMTSLQHYDLALSFNDRPTFLVTNASWQ